MPERQEEIPRGPRYPVNFTVGFYRSDPEREMSDRVQERHYEGTLENISSAGACLVAHHPLEIGEVVRISFPIQGSLSRFIQSPRTLAEVVWTRPASNGMFVTGFRFLL